MEKQSTPKILRGGEEEKYNLKMYLLLEPQETSHGIKII